MDNRLILSVAGSGKTSTIIDSLKADSRALIVTYTQENYDNLQKRVADKFGYVPASITILTYFSFLYSFCFRPFFSYRMADPSLIWESAPQFPRTKKSEWQHYSTRSGYLYSNRLAKIFCEFRDLGDALAATKERIERFFDHFYFDEVQDLAANDFNFVLRLAQADVKCVFVGDFYQHTYDTSRDSNVRVNLHKKGVDRYCDAFREFGFQVDTKSLERSYRCSPSVCNFVSERLGIDMKSYRTDDTSISDVLDDSQALLVKNDDDIVKLFLQKHSQYDCRSNNWGRSKGIDNYGSVCVVLNPGALKLFRDGRLRDLKSQTLNKLYVACSRARGDLMFADERHFKD